MSSSVSPEVDCENMRDRYQPPAKHNEVRDVWRIPRMDLIYDLFVIADPIVTDLIGNTINFNLTLLVAGEDNILIWT